MFCPKCAAPQTANQKFCRSCGLNLEVVSGIVADESKIEKLKLDSASIELDKNRRNRRQSFGVIVIITSLLVGCVIPIVIGLGLSDSNSIIMILAGIAGFLLFSGVIMTIYSEMPPKVSESEKTPPDLPSGRALKELFSADDFIPARSVAENTTRELETDKIKSRRKREN